MLDNQNKAVFSVDRLHKFKLLRSPLANAIRSCDVFGPPISMNFENKTTHQTIAGGIMTLCTGVGFTIYFIIQMAYTEGFYANDTISTYIEQNGYVNPQPGEVCNNGTHNMLSFEIYVNNDTFDNDDNPYGKLRLHQYSNMKNVNDTEG